MNRTTWRTMLRYCAIYGLVAVGVLLLTAVLAALAWVYIDSGRAPNCCAR